ncbi:hypothetical protein B0T17DRAFT_269016 [Bombardia bombarda]|uniref:Secreted protein n=1 Tax=Bombardia bombarda TaxID=252184 RepID=A0AA40C516_9PEZI|nr:hypothetical protein B0T17DRAFT_269016 [Bombardia bombarda]
MRILKRRWVCLVSCVQVSCVCVVCRVHKQQVHFHSMRSHPALGNPCYCTLLINNVHSHHHHQPRPLPPTGGLGIRSSARLPCPSTMDSVPS